MRYPKNFAKLTSKQEIKNTLGKIRGGEKLIFKEIDRPDLALLKDED